MNKSIFVFIVSLAALFFVVGCAELPLEPVETIEPELQIPQEVEQLQVEPDQPEPQEPNLPEARINKENPARPPPKQKKLHLSNLNRQSQTCDSQAEPVSPASFHDKCAGVLRDYVDENGLVNYRMLKRKKMDLKNVLDEFARLSPDEYSEWPENDKIALWLNAYNLNLIEIILDNYPIQSDRIHRIFWHPNSIRHIKGIWNKYKFIVMGEQFTLSEIEKRFFHKEFAKPLVFLAVSHASVSSPPLRKEPYYGDKLHEQLNDQVRKFLASPLAFSIDREKQTVRLSSIFESTWYGQEFVGKYGTDKRFKDEQPSVRAVLNFITNYIPEGDVSYLDVENYSVEYIGYDWRLNE